MVSAGITWATSMHNPYESPQSQLKSPQEQSIWSSNFVSAIAISLLTTEILLVYFGFLTYPALVWAALLLSIVGLLIGIFVKRPWILMMEFAMLITAAFCLYLGTQLFILDRTEVMNLLKVDATSSC